MRYPFSGKGSPEAIAAVLQVAAATGPTSEAPLKKPEEFQKYCDDHLGVDCNGFVGNFLRNELFGDEDTWWQQESETDLGPQNQIDSLFNLAPGVSRTRKTEVSFQDLNLLAEVDGNGRIIPGGSGPDGHTGISEPGPINHLSPLGAGPVPIDFVRIGDKKYAQTTQGLPRIWVTESTGPQRVGGVSQSWYQFAEHPLAAKSAQFKGVFRIFRGVKNEYLNFRIKAVVKS